jgi:pimeloyl-ACP methyl ester carboxylesterase
MALYNYYLARPGAHEVQLEFFTDYGSNFELYPAFQKYLRDYQPPVLAVWGENDPYFVPASALAFTHDVGDTEVRLLPTGHFALETHAQEIGVAIIDFFERRGMLSASA